ncbi:MAG: hypothetical protein MJ238_03850, partial [Bacilli bacterium]|nr:hypothetical protein [Bacilli bacterium]
IMALIATNIPMVKLFDGKDSKPLISNLCLAGSVTGCALALETILSMVFCNYTLNKGSKPDVLLQLALLAAMGIVICAASTVVLLNTKKGGSKIDTALIGCAGLISGGIFVALGVLAAIWKDDAVHLVAGSTSGFTGVLPSTWALGFIIMIIAVGVAIMGAGCAAFVFGDKKK